MVGAVLCIDGFRRGERDKLHLRETGGKETAQEARIRGSDLGSGNGIKIV